MNSNATNPAALKPGARFLYLYAEGASPEDPARQGDDYYVGKLLTAHREVVDLLTQLLGARTSTGRLVHRIEVGKPDGGAALEVIRTLNTLDPTEEGQ
ncbi:hypothetical protein ACF06W_11215 [Streptomyces albus]|uniref:hypothetical protein n=1 Tax=Streptomyces albus TaxID=1888 RepID=UPI0036FF7653